MSSRQDGLDSQQPVSLPKSKVENLEKLISGSQYYFATQVTLITILFLGHTYGIIYSALQLLMNGTAYVLSNEEYAFFIWIISINIATIVITIIGSTPGKVWRVFRIFVAILIWIANIATMLLWLTSSSKDAHSKMIYAVIVQGSICLILTMDGIRKLIMIIIKNRLQRKVVAVNELQDVEVQK